MEHNNALTHMLSQKKHPTALLNNRFEITWRSEEQIIEAAADVIVQQYPEIIFIEEEAFRYINIDSMPYSALVTPFSDKADEKQFILELLSEGEIVGLFNNTSLSHKISSSSDLIYSDICRTMDAVLCLSDYFKVNPSIHERQAVKNQYHHVMNALMEITKLSALLTEISSNTYGNKLNLSTALDLIIKGLEDDLMLSGRPIEYQRDGGNSVIAISERSFVIAIMMIVHNAFFYSPKNSPIKISLKYKHQNALITFENEIANEEDLPYRQIKSGLGLTIASRIFGSTGGTLSLELGDTAVTTVNIPIIKNHRGVTLSANFKTYTDDSLGPMRLILNDIKMSENEKH